jgi:hypothetical protein
MRGQVSAATDWVSRVRSAANNSQALMEAVRRPPTVSPPDRRDSTGLFVLGMHRSGTSVATRVVNLLGVATAANADLLPRADLNPTGFWESASLNDLNDEILRRFGGDSGNPPRLPAGWHSDRRVLGLAATAKRVFFQTITTGEWVWKDPRTCLTLPFWRRITRARTVVLIVYRNPLEVAASLEAHHGVGKDAGLGLWERYVQDALMHARDLPTYILSYSQLVASPPDIVGHLREFLTNVGFHLSEQNHVDDLVSSFVVPALRHYKTTTPSFLSDRSVSESQRRLFVLLEEYRGPHPRLPRLVAGATAEPWRPVFGEQGVDHLHRLDRAMTGPPQWSWLDHAGPPLKGP